MRQKLVFDIECAPDYFMAGFKGIDRKVLRQYEVFAADTRQLPRVEILSILKTFTVIGFNSEDYDIPVLFYALKLMYEAESFAIEVPEMLRQIKALSDHIIAAGLRGWQTQKEYGFQVPDFIDHIDLKEPVPGVAISLKLYGARLHSKRLQDLPYAHNEPVFGWPEDRRANILTYNDNDLDTTIDLWFEATKPSDNIIATREVMSKEFGIDLRSKSDAQIAEAAIKTRVSQLKGEPVYRSEIRPGSRFRFQAQPFIRFHTPELQRVFALVCNAEFVVNAKGGIDTPPSLADMKVAIGKSVYTVGIGGLHSNESGVAHYGSNTVLLRDRDVVSYYPSLILQCGLFPPNMGEHFQKVYKDFFDKRIAAKKGGDKSTAQTLKIVLNGAYGKLGSKWSVLYAPNLMIQVTMTGQLSLLMMIERMELAGIPCISANTDGVVMACPIHLKPRMDEIVAQWERDTGLETEETEYVALASRSVNSYVAVKPDGSVKTKGDLAKSDAQHNPSNEIVKKAVTEYVAHGKPVYETIFECQDIRQFITATRVTGGAQVPTSQKWLDGWTQIEPRLWTMWHGDRQFKEKRVSRPAPVLVTDTAQYLGKVVRFYKSTKGYPFLERVTNGAKVPSSDNAMPVMTLPDTLPEDIDYFAYINEAHALLRDIGVHQ